MDNGVQRRQWIRARIEAIRDELDELIRELGAEPAGDAVEQKGRRLRVIKGGMVLLLLALGAAGAASRYRRALLGATVAMGAGSVFAVALYSHALHAPGPARGIAPPSASISHAPAAAPSGHRAAPRPTPSVPPSPSPTVLPTRDGRTQQPGGGASVGPLPIPSLPAVPSSSITVQVPSPSISVTVGCSRLRIVLRTVRVRICV